MTMLASRYALSLCFSHMICEIFAFKNILSSYKKNLSLLQLDYSSHKSGQFVLYTVIYTS